MIDAEQRQVVRVRQRLRGVDADEQRARQPRARGDGDAREFAPLDACLRQRRVDDLQGSPPGGGGTPPPARRRRTARAGGTATR